jgi:hypothetical protein
MVSMFMDIRQAAELLAKFSSGHGLPRVIIDIASNIRNIAQFNGLQFYTQYRDPVDGILKVDAPANSLGASFWTDRDDKGMPFVRPNGYIDGETLKVILEANGHSYTPGQNDGEWVAFCVVSIEDIVKHPNFGFPKEKQDAILKAHELAAQAKEQTLLQPAQIDATQNSSHEEKPWMVKRVNDPEPVYEWYTPARYFARKLVLDEPTLLAKRDLLASKVEQSLSGVGIRKRGGIKDFNPGTIKKAFANVILN